MTLVLWSLLMNGLGTPRPGRTLDSEHARRNMISKQLATPGRNIRNKRVLRAMGKIPREQFLPSSSRHLAYRDQAISIGYEQTISQPYIVAFMSEQLNPGPKERILEIGTGSGYQTAVLAEMDAEVYSVEIIPPLSRKAEKIFHRLGYHNIHLKIGDGHLGWEEQAPFDSIIVTCAPHRIPEALIRQLNEGGHMIVPVGDPHEQNLLLLTKVNGKLHQSKMLPVRFVPMTGKNDEEKTAPSSHEHSRFF